MEIINSKYNSLPEQVEENKQNIKKLSGLIKDLYFSDIPLNQDDDSVPIENIINFPISGSTITNFDAYLMDTTGQLFQIVSVADYKAYIFFRATLRGAQGQPGPQGQPGEPNTLTIGTVTTGEPGTQASATITGTSPNQILNLTIPRGNTGATGQTGPIGPTGATGNGIQSVILTSDGGLDFTMTNGEHLYTDSVKGAQGQPGEPNTLTIGTVTTGEPGTQASATITGTSPNQILNLTIPRGNTGATGDISNWNYKGQWTSGNEIFKDDVVYYDSNQNERVYYLALNDIASDSTPPYQDETNWKELFGVPISSGGGTKYQHNITLTAGNNTTYYRWLNIQIITEDANPYTQTSQIAKILYDYNFRTYNTSYPGVSGIYYSQKFNGYIYKAYAHDSNTLRIVYNKSENALEPDTDYGYTPSTSIDNDVVIEI